MEQITRVSEFIEEQFEKWERPVVVTCGTGQERTGVFLACYLVYVGHSAASAIETLENSRPGCFNDNSQTRLVYDYQASIRPSIS